MSFLSVSLVLSLAAYAVHAAPNADVISACKEIATLVPTVYSGSVYTTELKDYWSYACVEAKPYCIVQPTTPEHVSAAVKILQKFPTAKFAVKSGGHDPNVGHASVSEGVLLALGKMKGATYDRARNVALVKPGGKWATVIGDLQPSGVTVVGGRLSVVGVGGLLLSGGLSFLSAQHGLAGDQVLEFQVVFPNGTISNVNAQNNPTLLRAMKGSNTQFGIVTQFTLRAYEMGRIYGGQKIYAAGTEDKLIEAFHDFTESPVDPKAAIIVTLEKIGNTILPVVFYFYQGPTAPKGVFKGFEDVKVLYDNTKTQSYLDLLTSNSFGGASLSSSQRTSFRSATFPNVPGDKGALQKAVVKNWKDAHNKYRSKARSPMVVTSLALQSFPTLIGAQTEKRGGNAMGLSAADGARWVAEFTTLWTNKADDDLVLKLQTEGVNSAENSTKLVTAKAAVVNGKKVETYLPFFMNDAGKGQLVTESFKEYETFKKLQREIDPTGFFKRAGGFKY